MKISKPAMLVYSFAPKTLQSTNQPCDEAHAYIRSLWEACACLGMTGRSKRLNLSIDFPAKPDMNNPRFRLLAARIDDKRLESNSYYQAFLFEYQDIFGLVATLETGDEVEAQSHWQKLYDEWSQCATVKAFPKEMIGEAYIFSGVFEDQTLMIPEISPGGDQIMGELASQASKMVIDALPAANNGQQRATGFYVSDNQFYFWEGTPFDDRRIIALLAPQDRKDVMFRWTVWPDQSQLAPFARYIIHASKLRFAQRVFERDISALRKNHQTADITLKSIIKWQQRMSDNQIIGVDELMKAQDELSRAQIDNYTLLYSHSHLKELRLTAQIANRNLQQLIPKPHPDLQSTNLSIFGQDIARATWLQEQISMDLEYMNAMIERTEEGHKIIALLLAQEAQRNARHLNNLILLQGSLLGALVVGLTAIQAFQPATMLKDALDWPLIGLLTVFALALPPLFARWHEPYKKIDRIIGGVLGAVIFLFSISGWHVLFPLPDEVSHANRNIYEFFGFVVGFLIGYLSIILLDRTKVFARMPTNNPSNDETPRETHY